MGKQQAHSPRFFKQGIPAMNLSHRKAFELFQKSVDGQLSAHERAKLDRHLATCTECQAFVALYHQLKKQAPAYGPIAAPSRQDIQQTIQKTQARFKRRQMFKRFLNPVQAAVGATIAVALTLALVWIFDFPDHEPSQTQTGAFIPSTPTTTQVATLAPSPTPTPIAPTATPTLTPTPRPTLKPTLPAPMVGITEEEVFADVDLNCDGLEERLVTVKAFTRSRYADFVPRGIVSLVLQVPAQTGYRQAWEYKTETTSYGYPAWEFYDIKLMPLGDCEQLLTTFVGGRPGGDLMIFHWDGRNMSIVLDVFAAEFTTSIQDGLVVTVGEHDCSGIAQCRLEKTDYVWNGTEFILDE